jgi:serine/threonine protein kinase
LNIIKNLPDCPNLVKIHKEHFESENNLYIFQEYCESGTLIQYRANKGEGHLSEDEIYNLFFQLCNGLITLLEAGIVHEDIKPANILKKGSLFKICDFGVSEMGECKETTTRKGTISYMPPEKLKSRRFLPNEKSDIYSLGVCLYEVIFAHHPYLKKKTSNYKEYLAILNEATQKPISVLMKNLGSSSLRLENFLKFLQKMIDLNHRTRVSLAELRQFIETTEPFKLMKLSEELIEI